MTKPIEFEKMDINQLSISEFVEAADKPKSTIRTAFPRYGPDNQYGQLFQLPKIQISVFGIPPASEFYKDDMARSFIRLPLDITNTRVKAVYDKIHELDDYLKSDAVKEKLFGTKAKRYKYHNIINDPVFDEDSQVDSKKPVKLPSIKLKLAVSNDTKEITTNVFVTKNEKVELVENIRTVDDIAKYVCFKSNVSIVILLQKIWANQPSIPEPKYGINFKVVRVKTTQPPRNYAFDKDIPEDGGFLDEDDDTASENRYKPETQKDETVIAEEEEEEVENDEDIESE